VKCHTENYCNNTHWFIDLQDTTLQNILLDKDGHCKLCEFGISKLGIIYGKKTRTFVATVWSPQVIITIYFIVIPVYFVEYCYICIDVIVSEFFVLYKVIIIIFIESIDV